MGDNDISGLVGEPELIDAKDGVSIDRWTNYGHDRLYINGARVEPYLDLKSGELGDTGMVLVQAEFDGDIVTVEIGEESGHGPHDIIVISLSGDVDEDDEDDEDDEEPDEDGEPEEDQTNAETFADVEEGDIVEQQEGQKKGARYRVIDLFHNPWDDEELISIDVEPLPGEPHRRQVSVREGPLCRIVEQQENGDDENGGEELMTDGGRPEADVRQALYLAKQLADKRYWPEQEAKAFVLKESFEIPISRVARELDVSESRVYNAVSAADDRLKDMREMLDELGSGELPPPDECAVCGAAIQAWSIDDDGNPICPSCLDDEFVTDGGESGEKMNFNPRAAPVEPGFGDSTRQRISFRRETKHRSAPGAIVAFPADVLPDGLNY